MTAYDRELLMHTLAYHQEHPSGDGCACGAAPPYPDHVVDVYERAWELKRREAAAERPPLDYGWANKQTIGNRNDPLPS